MADNDVRLVIIFGFVAHYRFLAMPGTYVTKLECHEHMFAGGKIHINGIELLSTLGANRHGNGNIFAVTARAAFEGIFGEVWRMTTHNFQHGDFEITAGMPHGFDGEVAGE